MRSLPEWVSGYGMSPLTIASDAVLMRRRHSLFDPCFSGVRHAKARPRLSCDWLRPVAFGAGGRRFTMRFGRGSCRAGRGPARQRCAGRSREFSSALHHSADRGRGRRGLRRRRRCHVRLRGWTGSTSSLMSSASRAHWSVLARQRQRAETAGLSWQQAAGQADSALHAALHPASGPGVSDGRREPDRDQVDREFTRKPKRREVTMTRRQLWRAYLEDAVLQGTEAYSYSPFCHLLSWGSEGPVSNVATCFESKPGVRGMADSSGGILQHRLPGGRRPLGIPRTHDGCGWARQPARRIGGTRGKSISLKPETANGDAKGPVPERDRRTWPGWWRGGFVAKRVTASLASCRPAVVGASAAVRASQFQYTLLKKCLGCSVAVS